MKNFYIMIIMLALFSGFSYASVQEDYFKIDEENYSSSTVNDVFEGLADVLEISDALNNIVRSYEFQNLKVDRDVFFYRLLSISGYNVYIEEAFDDALGLNLIDYEIYEKLRGSDLIPYDVYEEVMKRYLYFDLKNKEKNIVYYIVKSGKIDSAKVMLDGGLIVDDFKANEYFKGNYYYIHLSSKDIMKDYYFGMAGKNLLMDRSSYLFVPHVRQENFYFIDFFLIDRLSGEYSNLTDKLSIDFDTEGYKYYPRDKKFWVYESGSDFFSTNMLISYKEENMKLTLRGEKENFLMFDHNQDPLEPYTYYIIRSKFENEEIFEESILIDSKKYFKSYIGLKYRGDKNPTVPIYINKSGTSNYYYKENEAKTNYINKVFVYDENMIPYKGYLALELKDRSGKKYISKMRIKADGLVNIIFFDNRFNRLVDVYVLSQDGEKVSDIFSVNTKSNDNLIINIKQK